LSHDGQEEARIIHQGLTVEVTAELQPNQGECTDVLYPHPCLNFLVLFLSREKVRVPVVINED